MKYGIKILVVTLGLTMLFHVNSANSQTHFRNQNASTSPTFPTSAAQPSTPDITSPTAQSSETAAYYVSCSLGSGGSGTASSPFGSLAQAQSAMENSSIKTAIVSGTCTLDNDWNFSSADDGETWEAACGQVTTINGGVTQASMPSGGECTHATSTTNGYLINATEANNLTFIGFTFNNLASGVVAGYMDGGGLLIGGSGDTIRWNTFTNCHMGCITGYGVGNALIDSNTMNGISDGYPSGYNIDDTESTDGLCYVPAAIWIDDGTAPYTISNNTIENGQGGGIHFYGDDVTVSGNYLSALGIEGFDTGGIYSYDPSSVETGWVIKNNVIDNYGGAYACSDWAMGGVYLDNGVSNGTVIGNTIVDAGTSGIFTHGGSGLTFENNVIGTDSCMVGIDNDSSTISTPNNTIETSTSVTIPSAGPVANTVCTGGY